MALSSKIIQANLNNCALAQDLLKQYIATNNINIAFVSEYHRPDPAWVTDTSGKAALWLGAGLPEIKNGPLGSNFVSKVVGQTLAISCYLPPNDDFSVYRVSVDAIRYAIAHHQGPVLLAGDFNAKSPLWGCRASNPRGRYLAATLMELRVLPTRADGIPTFLRGNQRSVLDFLAVSPTLAGLLIHQEILDVYNASDHRYVTYEFGTHIDRDDLGAQRWAAHRLHLEKLNTSLRVGMELCGDPTSVPPLAHIDMWMMCLLTACEASMPLVSSKPKNHGRSVYWWTNDMVHLRNAANAARRTLQRAYKSRRRNPALLTALRRDHLTKKREFKRAIRQAKITAWEGFCQKINDDPWGKPYKAVIKAIRGYQPSPVIDTSRVIDIVRDLFVVDPVEDSWRPPQRVTRATQYCPPLTHSEVGAALAKIGHKKAPGLDQMPLVVLTTLNKIAPNSLLDTYQLCLRERLFPDIWKVQKLILIPKNKCDLNGLPLYRPISLIPVASKVYEHIIKARLETAWEEAGGFAEHQYGFRRGRSTVDALSVVLDTAKKVRHKGNKFMIMITVDVKNAFNVIRWSDILKALVEKNIPAYLIDIINSYLHDRKLVVDDGDKFLTFDIFTGVPQGSVIGPLLWNIVFDEVVRLYNKDTTRCVAFADDLAILVTAVNLRIAQKRAERAYANIKKWLGTRHLQIATEKTEWIQLAGNRKAALRTLNLEGASTPVGSSEYIKYLG